MRIKMCVQFASFIGYLIQTFFYIIFFVVVYFVCVLIWSELMAHHIPGSLWVFYCLINSVRVLLITQTICCESLQVPWGRDLRVVLSICNLTPLVVKYYCSYICTPQVFYIQSAFQTNVLFSMSNVAERTTQLMLNYKLCALCGK